MIINTRVIRTTHEKPRIASRKDSKSALEIQAERMLEEFHNNDKICRLRKALCDLKQAGR